LGNEIVKYELGNIDVPGKCGKDSTLPDSDCVSTITTHSIAVSNEMDSHKLDSPVFPIPAVDKKVEATTPKPRDNPNLLPNFESTPVTV
jgi:hypothetical protein